MATNANGKRANKNVSRVDANGKPIAPVTEAEIRQDLINALRSFRVKHRNNQTGDIQEEVVFAHRHAVGEHGVLFLMTDTMDGQFIRRAFREWLDVEEVQAADHARSKSGKTN